MKRHINILILGNSLVYFNDMPAILQGIIEASGKAANVESITKGSATMTMFASPDDPLGRQLRDKLCEKNYDYIFIEPSRRMTPDNDPLEHSVYSCELEASKVLKALADQNGAETIIYSVFGNNTGGYYIYNTASPSAAANTRVFKPITHNAHVKYLRSQHMKIAEALGGVKLAEAGYAFENILASEYANRFDLYHTDNQHPSPEGSYLVACTFYSAVFGERVSKNPYDYSFVSEEHRAILQKYSDKTMIEGLVPNI